MVKIVRRKAKLKNLGLRDRPLHGQLFLEALRVNNGWMSAALVGSKCGMPERMAVQWLARLVEKGLVETEVVDLLGSARTVEHSKLYRARP